MVLDVLCCNQAPSPSVQFPRPPFLVRAQELPLLEATPCDAPGVDLRQTFQVGNVVEVWSKMRGGEANVMER